MTKLLEQAIARLKTLPASEQDAIALYFFLLIGDRHLRSEDALETHKASSFVA